MASYTYCPAALGLLLCSKPSCQRQNLVIPVADLITRECATMLSGVDKMAIAKIASQKRWFCVDGDEYFDRFHPGEFEVDLLMGVKDGVREKILIADCKIQMKGGASIANLKSLPDVCQNIYEKYQSAKRNIAPIVPISPMYIIFNHAVAAVARRVLSRCSKGTNHDCKLIGCFHFECITIDDFRRLVA